MQSSVIEGNYNLTMVLKGDDNQNSTKNGLRTMTLEKKKRVIIWVISEPGEEIGNEKWEAEGAVECLGQYCAVQPAARIERED